MHVVQTRKTSGETYLGHISRLHSIGKRTQEDWGAIGLKNPDTKTKGRHVEFSLTNILKERRTGLATLGT